MLDTRPPLSPKQIVALNECTGRINILEGAVRSGKSYIADIIFLEMLRKGPEGAYLISGKNEGTIRRNILMPLNEITGGLIRYNRTMGEFSLFGKKVYVIGANDERAEGKIRGLTLAGAYIDEIVLLPESYFRMCTSRLSIAGAQLIGTTNPDSPYHWFKTEYIDRAAELDFKHFKFRLEDNPFLPPKYVEDLKKEYRGLWYKRFIEGEWVLAEGAIYDFFDASLHTLNKPRTYAKRYYLGIDYGTAGTFAAVLIGYNDDVRPYIWVEKEYYFDSKAKGYQQTDTDYAMILEREFGAYPIEKYWVDPSASSFIVELRRQKKPVQKAVNDVIDGIRFVGALMAQGDLMIVKDCKNLIKEIESYVWDSKAVKQGKDEPLKIRDHAVDAMRYAVYSQFGKKTTLKETQIYTPDERRYMKDPLAYPGFTNSPGWQRY